MKKLIFTLVLTIVSIASYGQDNTFDIAYVRSVELFHKVLVEGADRKIANRMYFEIEVAIEFLPSELKSTRPPGELCYGYELHNIWACRSIIIAHAKAHGEKTPNMEKIDAYYNIVLSENIEKNEAYKKAKTAEEDRFRNKEKQLFGE